MAAVTDLSRQLVEIDDQLAELTDKKRRLTHDLIHAAVDEGS